MKPFKFAPVVALLTTIVLSLGAATVHADNSDQFNFRFSPIPLVVGMVGLNLDIKTGDHWTVGPQLSYWHFNFGEDDNGNHINVNTFAAGVRSNWFKNGVYTDGLYVGSELNYINARASTSDGGVTRDGDASLLGIGALVGYGWFWKSFNMMLGGGVVVPLGRHEVTVTETDGSQSRHNVSPTGSLALEYSLGWTF